jgi:hypothetical protein
LPQCMIPVGEGARRPTIKPKVGIA